MMAMLERTDDTAMLSSHIGVREPYFALTGLRAHGAGEITGIVPVRMRVPVAGEAIRFAEGARHMAILGLCAAASTTEDGQRRFYLARSGSMTLTNTATSEVPDSLTGHARGWFTDTRTARAEIGLATTDGVEIARCEVGYGVFDQASFERVFGYARVESEPEPDGDPFAEPIAPHELTVDADGATALMRPSRVKCSGHFPGHPTLPVAVALDTMIEVCWRLIDELPGHSAKEWRVCAGELTADWLVAAGEDVEIRVEPEEIRPERIALAARARANGQHLAESRLRFGPIP